MSNKIISKEKGKELYLIATALFLMMISSSAKVDRSGKGAVATSREAPGEGRYEA